MSIYRASLSKQENYGLVSKAEQLLENMYQIFNNPSVNFPPLVASLSTPCYKVLVVEDTPLIAQATSWVIRKAGFEANIATTGQEAIEKARFPYNLILMDMNLPDMSGIEATKIILSSFTHEKSPKIVGLTTIADEVREECLKIGMKDVLAKPLSLRTLLEIAS